MALIDSHSPQGSVTVLVPVVVSPPDELHEV